VAEEMKETAEVGVEAVGATQTRGATQWSSSLRSSRLLGRILETA